jgi:prenyltransferase beta subunit
MLQVARLAPRLLGDSAALVLDFVRGQMNSDGGFKNRSGESDLYYSVFGIEGLLALRADLPVRQIAEYLRSFGEGQNLDLVHISCLARCWAALPAEPRRGAPREAILNQLSQFRAADGAYAAEAGAANGTIYGSFLATCAYQDAGAAVPDPQSIVRCVRRLRANDGGYANGDDLPHGLTPGSAAAATLLRNLGEPVPEELGKWLLDRHHPEGGFFATPLAPIPDLLSTATALHALAGMQITFDTIKEPCLDFVDSLWTNRGAFYGNWADDHTDCEYTYYGLLALGHLSL